MLRISKDENDKTVNQDYSDDIFLTADIFNTQTVELPLESIEDRSMLSQLDMHQFIQAPLKWGERPGKEQHD